VLFADVKGSMELSEQLDPEAFSQIMQRFFLILPDGVEPRTFFSVPNSQPVRPRSPAFFIRLCRIRRSRRRRARHQALAGGETGKELCHINANRGSGAGSVSESSDDKSFDPDADTDSDPVASGRADCPNLDGRVAPA